MCAKHNCSHTKLYRVWINMKSRCNNPNNIGFKDYGKRGITVCDEWYDFVSFKEWAEANGYDENAPYRQCTLDRIDVNGNYEPNNCRWVSQEIQNRNMRRNVYVEYKGVSKTIPEWSREFGIGITTLWERYSRGLKEDELFSTDTSKHSNTGYTYIYQKKNGKFCVYLEKGTKRKLFNTLDEAISWRDENLKKEKL